MKTEWDYTNLAQAYLKRPDYSDEAIDKMLSRASVTRGESVCDVGAGVAHLTLKLLARGLKVVAVEPNDAMRMLGMQRTAAFGDAQWFEGTGEETRQPTGAFRLVTFGSSFNVTDRPRALRESARITASGGWFACMWNHRDLSDPVQEEIETAIKAAVPNYAYGARREDQTTIILATGLTKEVQTIEGKVNHRQSIQDCVEAWRSHATLQRQAGDRFPAVISRISEVLRATGREEITVPYTTRIWLAQFLAVA